MYRPRLNRLGSGVLGFVLGLCVVILGDHLLNTLSTSARDYVERMRVSSPDHKLDAVLVEDTSGGAVGGSAWMLYIVPSGKSVLHETKSLFLADSLSKASIAWNKPHLVEIHYDKASIMQFTNISTTSENGLEYVELRLVPSSDYSLMTPEGGWRPDN